MYNNFNYNQGNYNDLVQLPPEIPASALVFNGYDLQSSSVISSILVQDNMPERNFETSPVPRGDGEIVTGDFWRRKMILIKGVIKKNTNALLEAEIDAMKKALAKGEGDLDIKIAETVRRYKATLINGSSVFSERRGFHITFCPFELSFVTVDPFATLPNYTSKGFIGTTDLSFDEQIDNDGTIRTKPVVILNFTSATNVTAISFKNNTRSEEIKLTKNIVAGDYVKFDSETFEVTVNGVIQDYTGAFPLLDTGANSITITVTADNANYDLTVKHKTSYL